MKKKWITSLGHADDRFIEEADPTKAVKTKFMTKRRWIAAISGACAVALIFCSVAIYNGVGILFGTNIRHYKNSAYFSVIEKLHMLKTEREEANKGGIFDGLFGGVGSDTAMPESPSIEDGTMDNAGSTYEEITDNQVAGVTEGDRIKRSSTHVYYLHEDHLYVYSIRGKESELVGKFRFASVYQKNAKYTPSLFELYLSSDCKTVTVMMPYYSFDVGMDRVDVCQIDVSDPTKATWKNTVTIDGRYQSSRVVDGDYLVLTYFSLYLDNIDYGKPESFIPQIKDTNGTQLVAPDHIIMPDALTDTGYTVVARLDGATMEVQGTAAFLSYASDVYVGTENIYATHYSSKTEKEGNLVTTHSYTNIARLSYTKAAFEPKGSVMVEGTVKDRYSLDEHNGMLRAVTTISLTQYREEKWNDSVSANNRHSSTNASLYCIDLATMQIVSSVEKFAPEGESVRSARYEGDTAYVCTAVVLTDPVYFFDLSDPMNITYKETEPIDGFSTSLVDFENGNLLGIGRTDWETLKVEIYKVGEDQIDSVCKFEMKGVGYSTEYKSYYIDRENQIVGIPIVDYMYNNGFYLLLHFDGEELNQILYQRLGSGSTVYLDRGFYKDGCFYMFGGTDFIVEEITLG